MRAGLLVLLLVLVAGCSSTPRPGLRVEDDVSLPEPLLADSRGWTLYLFAPDHHREVTCVQVCQGNWPTVDASHGLPSTGDGIDRTQLGTAPNPDGGLVLTYHGWPLYTYAGDGGPGQTRGQAVQLNGGTWYAVTPLGSPA